MAKRPEQTELPGIEQKKIKPVEDAAETLADERAARMAQQKLESEAEQKLIALLHKYEDQIQWGRDKKGNRIYQRGDVKVILEESRKEKVKVRIGEDDGEGDDPEAHDEPEE